MSILQTPPERDPKKPDVPLPSRYSELEHHELIYLLDEVDDERARARFRESIYISFIVWLLVLGLIVYGPVYLWHTPRLLAVTPDEQHHPSMTYLDIPKDLARRTPPPRPTPNVSERSQQSQSPTPSPAPAMPKQGRPSPPAQQPTPTPAPQQQAAPQQPTPQPQQPQRPSPVQSRQAPLVDSPTPAPQKPSFATGGSAGSQIAQAARGARGGGDSGNYGNGPQRSGGAAMGTQILSDMQGVDFGKYLARLLADVKRNWLPLIPEECRPPLNKQGITGVRFTIAKDGSISGMNLDYSTHDDAINRAGWGSIKALGVAQLLPPEFHGPNLELRIEFRINKDPQ